jgi:hypothetical protein
MPQLKVNNRRESEPPTKLCSGCRTWSREEVLGGPASSGGPGGDNNNALSRAGPVGAYDAFGYTEQRPEQEGQYDEDDDEAIGPSR